MLEKYIDESV